MSRTVFGSLARIADLATGGYAVSALAMDQWRSGDYVEAVVTGEPSELYKIEDPEGIMIPVAAGDCVVGALGDRAATLEGVGSWTAVKNGNMACLTNAGLLGQFTCLSTLLPRPISLWYSGHLLRGGNKIRMSDFALSGCPGTFSTPTVLLVGTSMSAGKTLTGRKVTEWLVRLGKRVIGAKLTGAGRYRDILSFRDGGATEIYDFVDVGLPSTVVPEETFRQAIRPLLQHIDSRSPDFLVAEAGASPLEPYNGDAAVEELNGHVKCTILCASDPYAVVGLQTAFKLTPDFVSGPATTTSAARDLVMKLTGVPAYNILQPDSLAAFEQALTTHLFGDHEPKPLPQK